MYDYVKLRHIRKHFVENMTFIEKINYFIHVVLFMVEVKSFKTNFIMANELIHIYSFSKKREWDKEVILSLSYVCFSFYMMRIKLWWYRATKNIWLLWIMVYQIFLFLYIMLYIKRPDFNYVLHEKICAHDLLK